MNKQTGAENSSANGNKSLKSLSTYEWRMPKKMDANGKLTQETIKLVDATNKQLKDFQLHCLTMLNNVDSKFPGRRLLLATIEEQREKCNAELFIREHALDGVDAFIRPIKNVLAANGLENQVDSLKITDIFASIPEEYDDLSLSAVIKAGERKLGLYDRTYMTLTFILSKGLNLTDVERDRYSDCSEEEIIEGVMEEIHLRNVNIPLVFRTNTGLSISQLQYLLPLSKKRYSEIPTDILVLLKDKMLPYLESDIKYHISQWEERIRQIEAVAESKGLVL